MNASDAVNVNVLLVWLLEFHDDGEGPSGEQACEAAAALADSALVASGTGICGDEVRESWHWVDDGYDVPVEDVQVAGERL